MKQYCLMVDKKSAYSFNNNSCKVASPKVIARRMDEKTIDLVTLKFEIEKGHAICMKTNLEHQQLFALGFDMERDYDNALEVLNQYGLPYVLTFSKMNFKYSRYTIILACNQLIENYRVGYFIQSLLLKMMPKTKDPYNMNSIIYPGENVMFYRENCFSIYDLILSFGKFVAENQSTNTGRMYKSLSKKTGIILSACNCFCMNMEECQFSVKPEFISYEIFDKNDNTYKIWFNMSEKNSATIVEQDRFKPIRLTDKIEQYDCCQLFNEFKAGREKITRKEWFGIMTNLVHVVGGQKLFLKLSESYIDQADTEQQIIYVTQNGYYPMQCQKFCPYFEQCGRRCGNIVETFKEDGHRIKKLDVQSDYISLEEMRYKISQTLYNCLIQGYKFSVIKAPTGAGKSYAYLQMIQNISTRDFIVAVPTGKLMGEIYETAMQLGIEDVFCTPVITDLVSCLEKGDNEREDLAKYIKYCYQVGDVSGINIALRESKIPEALAYLDRMDQAKKHHRVLMTTHARLLCMNEDFLKNKIVIIDEDILLSMMQTKTVKVNELERILRKKENYINSVCYTKLKTMLNGKGFFELEELEVTEDIKDVVENSRDILVESNLLYALKAKYFYKAKDGYIHFGITSKLCAEADYIVVSASADEMIYKSVFSEFDVQFFDLGEVEYKGNLYLHSDKTYSKSCLQEHPELIMKLRKQYNDCNIITFRDFAEYGEIYFGASQGFNEIKGEDLTVIGTFHRPDFVYKLFAMMITDTSVERAHITQQRVRRNGFSFLFHTYSGEYALLREIHLWMIESELIQAVGRARIISYDCDVNVYSNFPISQCKIS